MNIMEGGEDPRASTGLLLLQVSTRVLGTLPFVNRVIDISKRVVMGPPPSAGEASEQQGPPEKKEEEDEHLSNKAQARASSETSSQQEDIAPAADSLFSDSVSVCLESPCEDQSSVLGSEEDQQVQPLADEEKDEDDKAASSEEDKEESDGVSVSNCMGQTAKTNTEELDAVGSQKEEEEEAEAEKEAEEAGERSKDEGMQAEGGDIVEAIAADDEKDEEQKRGTEPQELSRQEEEEEDVHEHGDSEETGSKKEGEEAIVERGGQEGAGGEAKMVVEEVAVVVEEEVEQLVWTNCLSSPIDCMSPISAPSMAPTSAVTSSGGKRRRAHLSPVPCIKKLDRRSCEEEGPFDFLDDYWMMDEECHSSHQEEQQTQ